MKPLNYFVVDLPKTTNDEIEIEGGLKIYMDTKFNEFDHRVTGGRVVAVPCKYDTGVEVGDWLYFHHHVVNHNAQPLTGKDTHYVVLYDDEETLRSQAIAYKNKDDDIKMLSGWTLLDPVEEESDLTSQIIDIIEMREKGYKRGRLMYEAKWTDDLGIKAGDIIGFEKNGDYRIKIDGKEYFRVRKDGLMYAEV